MYVGGGVGTGDTAWIIGELYVPVLGRRKERSNRGAWAKGEPEGRGRRAARPSHGLGTAVRGDPWWTCGGVRPLSLKFTNRIDSWVGSGLQPIHKMCDFYYYYHCYSFSELRKSLSGEVK